MLINETKSKIWHGHVKVADTFFKRVRGLMFTSNVNYALVFILPAETRINASIHMFFMFQSIDVIFLNSAREVVDFKKAKPWRVYMPRDAAKYIIEGPIGIIKVLDIEIGDKIRWIAEEEKDKTVPSPSSVLQGVSFKKVNGTISLAKPKPKLKES